MESQQDSELRINVDGRTVTARLRPEDQATLAELLGTGANITVQPSDADTEGHVLADEIAVDVEGHAMTLRLPNAGDAAAIRRALAVGAVTATIVIGGAFAASTVHPQTQSPTLNVPRAVPAAQSGQITVDSDIGLADSASQLAAEEYAASRMVVTTGGAVLAPTRPITASDDSDQDINLANRGRQGAANQAPAQPDLPQPNRDAGSHPE